MMHAWWVLSSLGAVVGSAYLISRRTIREHEAESHYQQVFVERRGHVRYLRFDRGWQGAIHLKDPDRLLFAYQQAFLLFPCFVPDVRRFLALGVGTGTALRSVRRLYPEAELYGVEIDAEVTRAAKRFFACPDDERARYFDLDGRRFVEEEEPETKFDLVFHDCYADDRAPARMETVEFLRALKNRLQEGGAVFVNVIAPLKGRDAQYLRRVWRTYQDVFRHVLLVPTSPFPFESQNLLLIATDAPLPTRREVWAQIEASPAHAGCLRRLNRLVGRMMEHPPWSLADVAPLTDEEVRLHRHRP